MAMQSRILDALEQEYARRREENQRKTLTRYADISSAVPEIGQLLAARQGMLEAGVRGILAGTAHYNDLPGQMAQINAALAAQLAAHGYPKTWLDPVEDCPLCHDTGYQGEPVREMCDCMRRRYFALLGEELGLAGDGAQRFDTWDEQIFPNDRPLPGSVMTQREMMGAVRQEMQAWCDTWPEDGRDTVLIMGASGLGKTFLLRCMAQALLQRGLSVMLISAYRLIEEGRRAWMNQPNDLATIMAAQVLLVDDLGSEPLMQNVTIEQLYQVINERQNARLATVVSTNLTMENIKSRYTERIASRLSDRRHTLGVTLHGEDVRRR